MNLALHSSQWVLSLIIMNKAKLYLFVCHGWNEFSFVVEYSQIDNYHDQQNNQNYSISVKLIHEDFQTEST